MDAHGKQLNVLDLQSQMEWIKKDAESQPVSCDAELKVASLTASDRNNWAKIRREHFSTGINRDSLHAIEEAIVVVMFPIIIFFFGRLRYSVSEFLIIFLD